MLKSLKNVAQKGIDKLNLNDLQMATQRGLWKLDDKVRNLDVPLKYSARPVITKKEK